MGSGLIGSWCGVGWGAKPSSVTCLSMIGGDMSDEVERGPGIAGFGKKVGHLPLLRRKVVKVNPCTGKSFGRRKGEVLNRVRGAVLIFIIRKLLLKPFANIVGDGGFLEPRLDVSQSFVRETELGEKDSRWGIGGGVVTVSGQEVWENVFAARQVLNLKVALRECFPPTT